MCWNNIRYVVSHVSSDVMQDFYFKRSLVLSVADMDKQLCITRQVTRATHVRNRVCPRVELILKIIIILLIIFLGFIKSKPC